MQSAFPRSVDASLVENARPAKQYLSRAKTQRENELVHVRPNLQLASPGCCEKVSAKLLHLHRQNQRICLCAEQSLWGDTLYESRCFMWDYAG